MHNTSLFNFLKFCVHTPSLTNPFSYWITLGISFSPKDLWPPVPGVLRCIESMELRLTLLPTRVRDQDVAVLYFSKSFTPLKYLTLFFFLLFHLHMRSNYYSCFCWTPFSYHLSRYATSFENLTHEYSIHISIYNLRLLFYLKGRVCAYSNTSCTTPGPWISKFWYHMA